MLSSVNNVIDAIEEAINGDSGLPLVNILRNKGYRLFGRGSFAIVFEGVENTVWRITYTTDFNTKYLDYCGIHKHEYTPEVIGTYEYKGFHIAHVKQYQESPCGPIPVLLYSSIAQVMHSIAHKIGMLQDNMFDDILDIHSGNVMLDGEKLVATDPFADLEGLTR